MMVTLLVLGPGLPSRVTLAAPSHALAAQARAIAVDVRGPADEATALRATLQELTTRRNLAFTFESPGLTAQRAQEPWATVTVDLEGERARGGAVLTLREGAAGRVRLHRVVPDGANHQVTIETLATIAYTALVTLALDPPQRSPDRPVTAPRERAAPTPEREQPPPEADTANAAPPDGETSPPRLLPAPATAIVTGSAAPDTPTNAVGDAGTLTARAAAPAGAAAPFPVRFSLASFAGYQAGNLFGADRHASSDWWGMGVTAAGTVPRWPLAPALGLGLGAWYGTGRSPPAADGNPRPATGPRLQGQGEIRLTVLRRGRFSAALGPWLTVSRTTYDLAPAPPGSRGPGPNQGPPAPNALDAPSRATRTRASLGVAARLEAQLGDHFALYCALAGTTPLTADVPALPGDGLAGSDPASPPRTAPMEARWTLSALAGLSVALSTPRNAF